MDGAALASGGAGGGGGTGSGISGIINVEDGTHDRSASTSDAATSLAAAAAAAARTADRPNQFPWKLYDMIDTAEKRNEEHIISWIRDGTAFKVHDRDAFMGEYMTKMFNQTKYKSFQRQLNLWGFERFQHGPDKGAYYHPLFVKGNRECCSLLTRVRLKGEGGGGCSTGTGAGTGRKTTAVASKSSSISTGSRAAALMAAATTLTASERSHASNHDGSKEEGAKRHVPIAPAGSNPTGFRTALYSPSKISPGESSVSITTQLDVGVPSSSSFEVAGISYRQYAPPDQQVADLLQFHHVTSREERHRRIAAAAAALSNDSQPLLPVGSSDSSHAVDDRLSEGSPTLAGGPSIRHQDRVLQHLHQVGSPSPASEQPQQPNVGPTREGDSGSSSQERRPSNQMLALLAATEQHREEEFGLLTSLDQQNGEGASY